MRTIKTQGIILQKRNLGEKDVSTTIISPEYGRIQAHARGARNIKSKFIGHLDVLNICDFQIYQSPKNYIITECTLVKNFSSFRDKLKLFYIGSEIIKLIRYSMPEDEPCHDIYRLVLEVCETLEFDYKPELILEAFKIKLLTLQGFMPDLYGNENPEFIDIEDRIKKLIKFLSENPFGEIMKIALSPNEANSLQNATHALISISS